MNLPTDDDLSVTHAQLTMLTAHQRRVKRLATRKGREAIDGQTIECPRCGVGIVRDGQCSHCQVASNYRASLPNTRNKKQRKAASVPRWTEEDIRKAREGASEIDAFFTFELGEFAEKAINDRVNEKQQSSCVDAAAKQHAPG